VIAGPVEATAIGNVLMQMIGTENLDSVEAARVLVRDSFDTQQFEPQNPDAWTEPARRFAKL
jgi:rhamnulokinase